MKTTARPKLAEQLAHYEAWYDEQVRLGLKDIEAGRIVSHDEVVKRSAELHGELRKKHEPKAA